MSFRNHIKAAKDLRLFYLDLEDTITTFFVTELKMGHPHKL